MVNKAIIVLIIAVVLVGFLAAVFLLGDSGLDEFSIKSNDQLAELIIPKDTLPDDMNVDDISVTRVPNNEFNDESLIVYELEPDGLVFKDEILFKVSLDASNNIVPMVFVSTSTGIDLVNNTQTEIDLETKKQNVTVPLTHFSDVMFDTRHGTYDIDPSALDTPVGEQVLTNAKFTLYKDQFLINQTLTGGSRITVFELLEPRILFKGLWENIIDLKITPAAAFSGKPSLTDVYVGQTVTVDDDTFTCIESGPASIWYKAEITIPSMKRITYESEADYLARNGTSSHTIRNDKHTVNILVLFNCLNASVDEGSGAEHTGSTIEGLLEGQVEPEVKLSYNSTLNSQGLRVCSNVFVDVTAWSGANVTATLSSPTMLSTTDRAILDELGQTRMTFTVFDYGEYTVVVEIGEFNVEKKIWVGPK